MPAEITLKKVAQTIIDSNKIGRDDQVGGSSLGGIIAIEIAKILKSHLVVLIGSAKNQSEINPLLFRLAPISDVTPLKHIHVLAGKSGGHLGEMFVQSDTRFVREMCKSLVSWSGIENLHARLVRMHGGKTDSLFQTLDI